MVILSMVLPKRYKKKSNIPNTYVPVIGDKIFIDLIQQRKRISPNLTLIFLLFKVNTCQ